MAFVHLHNHTEYSLLDGLTHVKDMVRRAADLGMPAVAITDHGVMSGVPELCSACDAVEKETGKRVKPIYGCEVYFTDDEELRTDAKPKLYHLVLLAKNNTGYHNLLHLVSESHVKNFYYKPRTTFSMLQKYGEGLIGSSACIAGIIPKLLDNNQFDDAVEWANKLASCFAPGDFYIELQNQGPEVVTNNGMSQVQLNHQLTDVAKRAGLKTIATNDFHYLLQEDARAQDLMLCIGTGATVNEAKRLRFPNDQFYMKTEEEMRQAMADFPEACDNTAEVAEKCNVELERDSILPKFPLPEGESEESWFRHQVLEGLKARYGEPLSDDVSKRAEYEMSVIIQQGFPAYFLIVQEYLNWAREQGIGVGPGRGSAAGSIVAYAMGITDLEPLENGLLFERFLSPERVEMPDIDCDFEDERRGEVIDHIREVYGADHVTGVITFGKLAAKNAVRDAARVLDYPYSTGDKICKMIGDEIGITIDAALQANPEFKSAYEAEEDVRVVVDAARSIEGHIRGEGVHACATIICRDPMEDHVPIKRDTKGGGIITQYDGHYTPDLGLLKMDFLGLRTLSVLSRACRNIEQTTGKKIVPEEIPIDDEGAFELMRTGNMDGLFQVESSLYVTLFKRLPPQRFSDIVASIALNRPGPLESGMVDDYVKVASGKAPVHYYDARLRPVLEETYGTIVYQEQIMRLSMVMCGFSAGKADKLRKAMGKKKIDIMRQLKEDWNQGAVDNGYSIDVAKQIWDDAEKFAKYAFNKSHSAAYSILVMRTAYLKAHFPSEFMAAVLSSYMGKADALIRYISSCNHNGTPVLAPDINTSNVEFTPVQGGIRFGLVGVRGVGENVAEEIIAEREKNGKYTSLHNFVNRLDSKCYNRKVLEALIKSGAFDSTGYTRKQLMYFVDETTLLNGASKRQRDRDRGQMSLFDMLDESEVNDFIEAIPEPDGVEWPRRMKLNFEKEILKIYVSDHPLRPYEAQIRKITNYTMAQLREEKKDIRSGTFAGMVTNVKTQLTRRGTKMAKFTLEDTTGTCECICFNYNDSDPTKKVEYENASSIVEDAIIKIKGKFEHSDRGNQIMAFEAHRIDLAQIDSAGESSNASATANATDIPAHPGELKLQVSFDKLNSACLSHLNGVLKAHPGSACVNLIVNQPSGKKLISKLPVTVDAQDVAMRNEIDNLGISVVPA